MVTRKQNIIKIVSKLSDDKIDEVINTGKHKIEAMEFKIQACQSEKWTRNSKKGGNVNGFGKS